MSYFASSASPDIAHWHEEQPTHLMQSIESSIEHSLENVMEEARELCVTAEHTMESICEELGVHPFHHNFFGNLAGTTLALYSDGHLEIRREGQKHATSFPVQLIA